MTILGGPKKDFRDASEGDTSYPETVLIGPYKVFVVYYDAGVGIIGGRF